MKPEAVLWLITFLVTLRAGQISADVEFDPIGRSHRSLLREPPTWHPRRFRKTGREESPFSHGESRAADPLLKPKPSAEAPHSTPLVSTTLPSTPLSPPPPGSTSPPHSSEISSADTSWNDTLAAESSALPIFSPRTISVDKRTLGTNMGDRRRYVTDIDKYVLSELRALTARNTARTRHRIQARGMQAPGGGARMICMEDCALRHWAPEHQEPDEEDPDAEGPEHKPCISSCCWGCTHAIDGIRGSKFLNRSFSVEEGASGAEVYRARTVDLEEVFVKFKCVLGGRTANPVTRPEFTRPKEDAECLNHIRDSKSLTLVTHERFKKLVEMALQRLTAECGLTHLTVRTWTENMVAQMPNLGVAISDYEGLFSERAPGISLNKFANDRSSDKQFIADVLSRVNSSQILELAMHDLLFSEADRHAGNVHISEGSSLRLIDNDNALGFDVGSRLWAHPRGIDSMFLPGTERATVLDRDKALGVFDYRCHASGGAIGHNFPAHVKACLNIFSNSTPEELRIKYLIPRHDQAELLRERSKQLLDLGFELTLEKALEAEKTRYIVQKNAGAKITSKYRPDAGPPCKEKISEPT